MRHAYNGDFATKLIFDFTCLDRAGRMLLYELEEVLDAHVDCVFTTIARV